MVLVEMYLRRFEFYLFYSFYKTLEKDTRKNPVLEKTILEDYTGQQQQQHSLFTSNDYRQNWMVWTPITDFGGIVLTPTIIIKVTLGNRSFQAAARNLLNALPRKLREISDTKIF